MFVCSQPGKCFAKRQSLRNPEHMVCEILMKPYKDDEPCPFQKEHRLVTDGVYYPFNPNHDPEKQPYLFIEEDEYNEETIDFDLSDRTG